MRLPDKNQFKHYDNYDKIKHLKFGDKIEPLPMRVNILSDKDKAKAIKHIENAVIRPSLEYKTYIKFLREKMDMNKCSFFDNVSNANSKRVKIEIHHSPLTLFDITSIVAEKQMHEKGEFNYFKIGKEVVELHYQCRVGLIPLSSTVHSMVHNGTLFIPLYCPRGNYISFLDEYSQYISRDLTDMLEDAYVLTKQTQDLSILDTVYTYIDYDGFKLPQFKESSLAIEHNLKNTRKK